MILEDEWTPRPSDGQDEDGYNREKKPLVLNRNPNRDGQEGGYSSRPSYNSGSSYNREGGGYNRSEGGYNSRPSYGSSYNREGGGYNSRPSYSSGSSYNRPEGGYGSRPSYSSGNSYSSGSSYNRPEGGYNSNREGGYNDRPARPYTPRPYNSDGGDDRKRRPRVGEETSADRFGGSSHYQSGGYNSNRYPSNERYPQNERYPANDRNPSNERYPSNNRPTQPTRYDKFAEIKKSKYREEHFDPNEPLRLNKYLANAGVCSRREADEFIQAGVVSVNGAVVTELGTKVKRADEVMFHDQPVRLEAKMYIVLNKPKNCVTTADDPQERLTVMDLVKTACHERIFPVGRLDRNTTGVLLLTNDGDLASKLTHPKFEKKKIYHVWLDKDVSIEDMEKLAKGIELDDGEIHADAVSYVTEDARDQVGIEIHSGRNRVVRRMFESLGYHVNKLDRVYFAGMTKKNLKRGHWRYLTEPEVNMLRQGRFE
ncbi:ribosomal large subunit pseudouridine synthase B [Candidatus Symbiothrix dinenymphae]|nr:ribosomal large subunit pseudouridine synthase B [Candidatus Symbiothrix dinenymphae]